MNSPMFLHSNVSNTQRSPLLSTIPVKNTSTYCSSLVDRVRLFKAYIDEADERDLYNFFIEIVLEIFGRGPSKGWALDKLKTRVVDNQKYICREPDSVYHFLKSNGYIFKLCYKLLSNGLHKFNLYFYDIPIEVVQKIENSFGRSYYGSRFLYHGESNVPVGLSLNSFEYVMFHFAVYGLKLTSDDLTSSDFDNGENSVYKLLCVDYLNFFLPLDNSASMILPQMQLNVVSTIQDQKQSISPSKPLNFIKKDVICKEYSNDKIESSTWILTSEATWRSELLAFFFADIWLNCNLPTVPSIDLTKLIRYFIKHLHLYSNRAKYLPPDNLKLILTARHGIKIYQYLAHYMIHWPQDFSFRYLLENWLCFIQPWRYEHLTIQQYSITDREVNEKWRIFFIRNLLCYTKLFYLAIKRFTYIDICSPRYSIMVYRTLKVFTHPYLLKTILDIEQMYINNHQQHKKWNILLSECLVEAEGPLFQYKPMFSEDYSYEYKLFYSKLQKSLDHVTVELKHFYEDNTDKNNSSMLELILAPRKNKIFNYTLSEWEDIQTNLKSSLLFMEQIINVSVTTVPLTADLSAWSISGANNTANSFFSTNQSFSPACQYNSTNFSSRSTHTKEWEIDPDFLESLSYENDALVKLSKCLRNIVETHWNSYILKFSMEETVFAGVLRQTIIRKPMKIFSYEPRNYGSKKRVRTPKIIPPTISFRWIASYFSLTWILFLLLLALSFNNFGYWVGFLYIFRIIYFCLKYFFGYAPPYKWNNLHED